MPQFKKFLVSITTVVGLLSSVISASANTIVITSTGQNPQLTQSSVQNTNNSSNVIVISGNSNNQIIQKIDNQPTPNVNITNWIDGSGFNMGNVISDKDIYSLPEKFDSASKIRDYLRSTGSFLADYKVEVGFEKDDELWALQPTKDSLEGITGTKIDFADFVWKMARTKLGSTCSIRNKNVCVDQAVKPINPAVILALIQRESGLIRGKNARLDPNNETAKFLVDRAVGYLCLEDDNKSNSCWDQNPEWKYYKGMFRQVYYGMRLMLLNSQRCNSGTYGNKFRTGNVVNIDGTDIKLENGFSCSIYIYTPHIMAQRSIYKSFKEISA
jgi:hypothetical protein